MTHHEYMDMLDQQSRVMRREDRRLVWLQVTVLVILCTVGAGVFLLIERVIGGIL